MTIVVMTCILYGVKYVDGLWRCFSQAGDSRTHNSPMSGKKYILTYILISSLVINLFVCDQAYTASVAMLRPTCY